MVASSRVACYSFPSFASLCFAVSLVMTSQSGGKMVGWRSTMITTRFFAVFFAFVLFQTCSSASPGLSLENYGQIAQQFGFPLPFPLQKFNFSDVSKECHDTVTYLSRTALAKKCKYNVTLCTTFLLRIHGGLK